MSATTSTIRKFLPVALLPLALLACATEADLSDAPPAPTTTTVEGARGDWQPADDAGGRGPSATTTTTEAPAPTTTTAPPPPATTTTTAPPESPEVSNARRSADSYIEMMPFSRSGLIGQLEFEGYSTEAATIAVDSLAIDYHAQAVRSATSYLEMMPFSHSGLVDQLVFEGYTPEQAEHGTVGAGL